MHRTVSNVPYLSTIFKKLSLCYCIFPFEDCLWHPKGQEELGRGDLLGKEAFVKTKTASTERGSSCFLYFSFYLPSQVTAKLSQQVQQRHQIPLHWECQHLLYRLAALTSLPFSGRFGDFSCPEGKSQGDKSSQLVLLATRHCLISVAEGSFFPTDPAWLNPTVATSWSLHVNSTHIQKQLGSLSKCWHSQPSPWSPAQAQKLSAVRSLQYGALTFETEPRSVDPKESQVKLGLPRKYSAGTHQPLTSVSAFSQLSRIRSRSIWHHLSRKRICGDLRTLFYTG